MIYHQLRQKLTKLTRFNRKRRQHRVARFEQLEVRHLLAAAVWTNVLQPLDVSNNDGTISPLDALLVINELNLSAYAARHEPLPLEIPDTLHPPFIDVSCDGFVSPIDALLVINRLNNRDAAPLSTPSAGKPTWKFNSSENSSTAGKFLFNTCSPQLVEGSSYTSQLSTHLTLPDSTTAIQVKFDTPVFDLTSQQTVRDAFEILVLDDAGQSLVLPYSPGRDAAFNWSEGLSPVAGLAAQYSSGVATINLSGIAAGTSVHVVARLDNNDLDNTSSVIIRGINFVDSQIATPLSYTPPSQSPLQVDTPELSSLVDVSGSLIATYGATSISESDNSLLSTQLNVANTGNFSTTGQLIAAIDNISEPNVNVFRPDGFLQDGRPFFDLTSKLVGGSLAPGQSINPRDISFRNLSGKRFSFHINLLSKVASPPTGFASVPVDSIEAGKRYHYVASATEPSQTPLKYSIVTGPEALTIDAGTGELNWQTAASDVGSHSVTVRATNKFDLSVDQAFTIRVQQSLQNRPPVFTSIPGTEATTAGSFEVLTLATGSNPTGLAVGDFGSGNTSLVAINAGDQSLSYIAGLGGQLYSPASNVSVGEPPLTGDLVRAGIEVNLGLRPLINPTYDSNRLQSFATADFNGDGNLDSATVVGEKYLNISGAEFLDRFMVVNFGNGDGTFGEPMRYPFSSFRTDIVDQGSMFARDFDGDGVTDLLVFEVSSYSSKSSLFYFKGKRDGTFAANVKTEMTTVSSAVRIADFNGDGKLDLLAEKSNNAAFGLQLGNGDGTFQNYTEIAVLGSGGYSINAFAIGDLNGDGKLDIAAGDWGRSVISIFLSNSDGTFAARQDLPSRLPMESRPIFTSNPSAVVIGDFTGDGKEDIAYATYGAAQTGGGVGLYTGDGSGTAFTYKTAQAERIPYRPVSFVGDSSPVDVNNDGFLDLLFASQGSLSNQSQGVIVGLNDGTGNFELTNYVDATSGYLPTRSGNVGVSVGAIVGDFNRDGMLDLLAARNVRSNLNDFSGVSVLLADSPGSFRTPQAMPIGIASNFRTEFLMTGDFNNDGIADLWGPQHEGVSITRLGNGDGTFKPGLTATPYIGNELLGQGQVADFDHDGNQDILWIGGGGIQGGPAPRYIAALGNGDGTFRVTYTESVITRSVEAADFNGDGRIDFVARGETNAGPHIEVMLSDPANPGKFTRAQRIPIAPRGGNSAAMTVNDFDGDGKLDVAIVLDDRLQVFHGNGDGTLTELVTTPILSDAELIFPKWMDSGDLNHDGFMDIVMTGAYYRSAVLLGKGDGTFGLPTSYKSGVYWGTFRNVFLTDIDDDANLDFVSFDDTYGSTGRLAIRRGLGDGTFSQEQLFNNLSGTAAIALADFDNDGHSDFVATNIANFSEAVLFQGTRPGLSDVVTTDFNGDGRLDVLSINTDNSHVKLLAGSGNGSFTRLPDLLVGPGPVALASGNFNGDNKLDFVTANRSGKSLSVMLATAAGSYTRSDISLDAIPIDVQAGDINDDGKLDLAVIDIFHNSLQILLADNTGAFEVHAVVPLGDKPSSLSLSDVNADGKLDAVITLPQSQRIILLTNNGAGGFTNPTYVATTSTASKIATADLNSDGSMDLAVTLPAENRVDLFFGMGNQRFSKPQSITVGSRPNSIEIQDTNKDGRPDILVTNSGDATASVILNKFDPTKVYRYQAVAVDPDSDPVTYSVVQGPGGVLLDSQTGAMRWAPTADQVGLQTVTIQADDGRGGIATQQFTISVQPPQTNASPIFTSLPKTTIAADQSFSYAASAVDNDKDYVRYRIVSGPEGASIDPTTGVVQWDPRGVALDSGSYQSGAVKIPNSTSLNTSSLTMEGWFTFNTTGNQVLIWKDAASGNLSWSLRYQFGNLMAAIGAGSQASEVRMAYPWTPQLGKLYHIAASFNDVTGALRLFINGNQVGEISTSKRIANFDLPLYLGFNGSGDRFKGTMSQVRIWSNARTQQEIAAGMNQAIGAGSSNLIAEYRFDEGDAQSVFDSSGNLNHGLFMGDRWPQRITGLATAGANGFTISVEDGKGGYSEQSFTVQIVSPLRGAITGTLFNDVNGDGSQQSGETTLSGQVVYLDANGNGQLDASESQTTTDANGRFAFNGLVVGSYQLRAQPKAGFVNGVSKVVSVSSQTTIANLPLVPERLSQLRGEIVDDRAIAVAHMQVFADLDRNGLLDENEPSTWTDSLGTFALSGLAAGSYSLRVNSRPGWSTKVPNSAAHDAVLAANQTINDLDFVVAPQNEINRSQPVFVSTPPKTAQARSTYSGFAFAFDPSGSPIAYSLSVAPAGMVIDPATGRMVWTPVVSQIGKQRVIVRAMNESGSVALQDFEFEVAAPNSAPVVTSKPSSPVTAGKAFQYAVEAQDAEQTALKYTLLSGPSGATVDLNSGVVSWTPTTANVGNADFVIAVSDSVGGVAQHAFTLTVVSGALNTVPFVIQTPRSDASLLSKYLSRIDGVDATGQRLTTELRSGPTGLTLDSTGLIQWMPTTNQLGPQNISVRYHSPTGSTEDHQFTITVKQVVGNSNPTLDSTPHLFATVEQLYSYDVAANDRDQDALAFELVTGPAGMSINPATGTIRWLPASDQRGVATVTIRVNDPQGGSATQSFSLNTRAVGGPPSITSVPPTQAVVGRGYLYSVLATDAEADLLSYTLLQAPTGMTINARTGEIAWTPTAGQIGQQSVIISVSDALGGASTQGFAIQVLAGAPNLPPVISSEPVVFSTVGQTYVYDLVANDPEGTQLTYSLRRNPSGMQIDSATGRVSWTPTAAQSGRTVVTIVATDAAGGIALQSFELDVLAANHASIFVSATSMSVFARAVLKYDAVARDADLDPLTYEIVSGAMDGMTIDAFGRIRWTTNVSDIGTHSIEVRARDPRGGVAMQTVAIQVLADTAAPRVTVLPTPGGWPWDGPIVVFVSAVDNVGVTNVELKVNDRIVALDANRMARLYADDWGFGLLNMVATARDAAGNVGSGTGVSAYRNPDVDYETNPAKPTAIVTSPTVDSSVVGMVRIEGTAGGPDFKEYRLSYARADQLSFTEFAHSTTKVTEGLLGTWDTTLLENDAYIIRLEVTDVIGSTSVVDVPVGLSGALKLGNFRLSFEDMTIPVAGIQITIVRTYDTLRADRDGDFGYGWRLEFRNTDLRTSLPKSGLEDIGIYTPFKQGTKVYLTLPGGERQGFTFTPEIRVLPGFGRGNDLVIAFPRFTADRGITSTLSAGGGSLLVNEFGEMYVAGGIPWNPSSPNFAGYTLTTREGVQYKVDSSGNLSVAIDRNGNSLSFNEAGISSASGVSVTFNRDAKGRIVAVTDPAGNSLNYGYDVQGDLLEVTDRTGNMTKYAYRTDRAHYLESVIDPLGRVGVKSVYGADGRLTGALDATGHGSTVSYDPDNSLVTTVDAIGNKTISEYDSRGNVVGVTDALGSTMRMTYDDANNITSRTDALGHITSYSYDGLNRETTRTLADGSTKRWTYDAFGGLASVTSGLGETRRSTFDNKGNKLTETTATGATTTFAYDERGLLTTTIDAAGYVTTQDYDSKGRKTVLTRADGSAVTFSQDAFGQDNKAGTWVTTANGRVLAQVTTQRDGNGQIVAVTDATGTVTSYTHNAAGQPTAVTTPLGAATADYDANGNLIQMIGADGLKTQQSYDAMDRPVTSSFAGLMSSTTYDALGRAKGSVGPGGTTVSVTYDAGNQPTSVQTRTGTPTRFTFDKVGLAVAASDESGERKVEYDAAGRVAKSTDATGTTLYAYDADGNVIRMIAPDGGVTSTERDARGLPIRVRTALGYETRFEYDGFRRVVAVIDSTGGRTSYGYDELDRLTTQTDSHGRVTRYEYDLLGRRTAVVRPDGSRETSAYDAAGRLTRTVNAAGQSVDRTYDTLGRLSTRTTNLGQVTYTRNALGLPTAVSDSRGTARLEYDSTFRLIRRTEANGRFVAYTYNSAGRVASIETPSGTVAYEYDADGRTTRVQDPAGGVTMLSYDAQGRVNRRDYPNGLTESTTYDSQGRRSRISLTRESLTLDDVSYAYDIQGRLFSLDRSGVGRTTYTYDAQDRLILERLTPTNGVEQTTTYTYDTVGNRLTRNTAEGLEIYSYDASDRLLAVQGANARTYSYDQQGRVVRVTYSPEKYTMYEWDADDRLTEARITTATGTTVVAYLYDAAGNLVQRTENGDVINYLIDANRPLAEIIEETGNTKTTRYTVEATGRLAATGSSGTQYLHSDRQNTLLNISDATGQLTRLPTADAFGISNATVSGKFYAGLERDSATGLDYARARRYDSTTGRFLSRDAFSGNTSSPLSQHDYLYAAASPTNNTDPTGYFTLSELTTTGYIQNLLRLSTAQAAIGAGLSAAFGKTVWSGPTAQVTVGTEVFGGMLLTTAPNSRKTKTSAVVMSAGEGLELPDVLGAFRDQVARTPLSSNPLNTGILTSLGFDFLIGSGGSGVSFGNTDMESPALFGINAFSPFINFTGGYLSAGIGIQAGPLLGLAAIPYGMLTYLHRGAFEGANGFGVSITLSGFSMGVSKKDITLTSSGSVGISLVLGVAMGLPIVGLVDEPDYR